MATPERSELVRYSGTPERVSAGAPTRAPSTAIDRAMASGCNRRLWAVAFVLCLALPFQGCATRTPDAGAWTGRLALDVAATADAPAKRASLDFELSGNPAAGNLELAGPLGTLLARARWQAGSFELDNGREQVRYASLSELAEASLGEPMPFEALFDWLQGRPWPGAPSTQSPGHPARFVQLGWQVDATHLAAGLLQLERAAPPTIILRIRLERAPARP